MDINHKSYRTLALAGSAREIYLAFPQALRHMRCYSADERVEGLETSTHDGKIAILQRRIVIL